MIKIAVFDLDDTLYPEARFVRSGFAAVDRWVLANLGQEGFYDTAIKLFDEGKRGDIFNQAAKHLNLGSSKLLIEKLVGVYREHLPSIQLYDDAKWILENLKGVKLALITDGYLDVQKKKVQALGLEKFFELIIFSDQYGRECWKPSLVPFQKVMEYFRCTGEDCVYIGDNPEKDFAAPNVLGWDTVQVKRKEGQCTNRVMDPPYQAKKVVDSLFGFHELIR
ncbi:MAG: HAD family hydrolase [Desulfitobacteriaceae bacterium]|nr:HAD family hydrolase [Desulfitobacteriaceae bacterium]MDD4751912.1 HAD family hydrolase [Desulfitobacteriaceae bacterium]